ncbi:MAG: hypothetical protein CGU28_11095 [Candidatus Dactylopiibacterium carminicum]|uniref:Uncharacterized protein n=1 Tax=Candidatus Dactylopiibacterium carminicum TaxID=857335 RepID=A0A272ESV4_9RHOO|nr:hypothetical protein BGI27_01205 [Candidatus Dactylopiibacterium carminicum]PAS93185.1 MAG: hypothetical protein CGU29_08655 [Candidatus Dactylopiibacterium carminicum]PAS95856.1 MAG: hypothetical protein CGU28_11095 [Candidatus Dactylopiibacterium carminicum]
MGTNCVLRSLAPGYFGRFAAPAPIMNFQPSSEAASVLVAGAAVVVCAWAPCQMTVLARAAAVRHRGRLMRMGFIGMVVKGVKGEAKVSHGCIPGSVSRM